MKGLSDWQSVRVRDALRTYHHYERDIEGQYFTWKDVREAIAVYTDVEIGSNIRNGAEMLRKFVEGVLMESGDRNFHAPKPDALEAIIAFVTHEDINLLTEDELKEFTPGFQAPLRLLEYLEESSDEKLDIPPSALEGRYRLFLGNSKDELLVKELVIQRSMENGLIQVIETDDLYDSEMTSSHFSWLPPIMREKNLLVRKYFSGWAVLTPESNLLFFMKDGKFRNNHYYFTVGSDMRNPVEPDYVTFLILLHHDYHFETEKGKPQIYTKMVKEIATDIPERIFSFMRIY